MTDASRRDWMRALLRGVTDPLRSLVREDQRQDWCRPPGALPEPAFLETCDPDCRDCVDACPRQCIIPAQKQMPPPTGTPFLIPDRAACDLCLECIPACPTGALQPTEREAVRIGEAILDLDTCRTGRPSGCRECRDVCPVPEQAIRFLEEDPRILSGCTGCGLCAIACPTDAISIRPPLREL